jgi:mono/diheme cytochrome c family protein
MKQWKSSAAMARGRCEVSVKTPLIIGALLTTVTGCSWFTDFKQQPKIDPWESVSDSIPPRGNPQYSVPVFGTAAPGYAYGRAPLIPVIDSMSGIPNPTPADQRSLNNGRINFQINCAVCHGPLGHGDGTATKFGMAGISLVSDVTKNRTDGYIFGMIRNGRGLMPTYNRIEEPDRWDIVNYVRSLQGKLGATPPDTSHGRPGQNGTFVPGASVSAPTRPAPYYHHIYPQAGTRQTTGAAGAMPNVPNAAAVTGADSAGAPRAADSTQRRRP